MLTIHATDYIFFHENEERFSIGNPSRDQMHFEKVSTRVSNQALTTFVCNKLKIVISTEMRQVYP
jgi:hypothetical protein